jgi:hypothetical protein
MNSIDFNLLKNNCPKAWGDFLNYYSKEFSSVALLKGIKFVDLPFEFQLGIYLKYFNANGVELDVCNTDFSLLPDNIIEAFHSYEKVISHYS